MRMGTNPTVEGCMQKGGPVYLGDVHTAPDFDHGDAPDYSHVVLPQLDSSRPGVGL